MRGDLVLAGPPGVEPPLPGQRDHADEHLRVHRGGLGVLALLLELVGEQVLDLRGHVADQAGERAGRLGDGGVAHEDPEAVLGGLDVPEQGERGPLDEGLGVPALLERRAERAGQGLDLPVDDDRVDALLAAEVLVHDGLGHLGAGGDLLDARAVEPLLGEQAARHVEQLRSALRPRHAEAGCALGVGGHAPIMP